MRIIRHSKFCPFDFTDWYFKDIKKIFAGNSCVMAITEDGKVLQKVENEDLAARTEYWTRVKSIAISQFFPALAVGLIEDGTCMVSKRALRHCCSAGIKDFDRVNDKIKSLKNIVEIVVSDAIFALDSFGKVHHIPLRHIDTYYAVDSWHGIRHIAAGSQDSVFGVTNDGRVVCAGLNCINGYQRNKQEELDQFKNVIDICVLGAECEKIILALSDGRVIDYRGNDLHIEHCGKHPVFCNDFILAAVRLNDDKIKCIQYNRVDGIEKVENAKIELVAVGTTYNFKPFAVWYRK